MSTWATRLLSCLIAVLILAVSTGIASANRDIGFSGLNISAAGRLTFSEGGGGFSVICRLTFTYTIRSVAPKARGATLGGVPIITANECTGGRLTVLGPVVESPWSVRYETFRGTLPNISELVLELEIGGLRGFLLEVFFGVARCLYGGPGVRIRRTTRGNPITSMTIDSTRIIPIFSEALSGFTCPSTARLSGTLTAILGSPRISLL